jgi:hypothetical protein
MSVAVSDVPDLILFDVVYLTKTVNLDLARQKAVEQGLVCYSVYAKNAEDAIRRLREQEPIKHPIVEIARVNPAPPMMDGSARSFGTVILPVEYKGIDARFVKGH